MARQGFADLRWFAFFKSIATTENVQLLSVLCELNAKFWKTYYQTVNLQIRDLLDLEAIVALEDEEENEEENDSGKSHEHEYPFSVINVYFIQPMTS
jgi:hypothetical protein